MNSFVKTAVAFLATIIIGVSATAAQIGTVNVDVLNVREHGSLEAPILGQLNINMPVEIMETSNGWSRIAYQGADAYVLGQYINVQFLEDGATFLYGVPKFGQVLVDCLNVRVAATFDAAVARQLYLGKKVELIGESGEFYLLQDGAVIQFVAKAYIGEITYDEYVSASAGQNVLETAMRYIGTPYRYGGSSPSGFDCSGFTSYVYAQLGISLNRTAAGQMQNGTYVDLADLQAGDLVFFGRGYINHVGIYVGDGNMIHAPYSGRSVCIESIYNGYFGSRIAGARRIFE